MSKRICVFGSSIGHGHNDDVGGGWCDRLKIYYFANKSSDISVYNLSVSGAMSKDVLDRFDNEYNARQPKIVLITIGINDSAFDKNINGCRISLKDTKSNLEQLVAKTKEKGSRIMFIGLTSVNEDLVTPIPWASNVSYSNKNIKKYDNVIKEVAEINDVPYCYMFDLLQKDDLDDGLHPNAKGHEKMFERIKDFLIESGVV